MFSLQNVTARARQAAAAGKAAGARRSAPKSSPFKRRVRYAERDGKVIAQVEERHGFRWTPTVVTAEVDLKRMAVAHKIEDALKRGVVKRSTSGGFLLTDTAGDAATPWDHFQITDADDTAGFWKKVKKAAKKVAKNKVVKIIAKAHTVPLKKLHKITHGKNSPIAKAEKAMQKAVGKALPFTKPFIAVHNKLANPVHKLIEGKKLSAKDAKAAMPTKDEIAQLAETTKRVKAGAIAKVLEKVPAAQQAEVKKALIDKANSWIVISPRTGLTHTLKL